MLNRPDSVGSRIATAQGGSRGRWRSWTSKFASSPSGSRSGHTPPRRRSVLREDSESGRSCTSGWMPRGSLWRPNSQRAAGAQRDTALERIRQVGRREWQKESGYRQQARVENSFFRYKSVLGGGLKARHGKAQRREVAIGCHILNRMAELGRPSSYAFGR